MEKINGLMVRWFGDGMLGFLSKNWVSHFLCWLCILKIMDDEGCVPKRMDYDLAVGFCIDWVFEIRLMGFKEILLPSS